ncbi:protein ECERIFERUM 26-like [Zingiber officinale]|uniref:Uncharacterized protein n=1 Tax=Zingiber officinale TaxID=94328 RepID=A0A8J5GYY7_ZINOF|nr:protein ECERIFERUM 26-like [Zingiber officinale]KAG6513006.1 hypothetical protein ZIOFF_031152 [Zingiber officinale]
MTAGRQRRVTLCAKTTVVSAIPVRPGKTHALSALDHAMTRHFLHLVFYFRAAPALTKSRLMYSLSEVLSYYPAVTGRLHRQPVEDAGAGGEWSWVVKCTDAGLRFVEARAHTTLDEWLATATDEEEMELAHSEPMGHDPSIWSSYCVQLTEFDDGAVAIGLSSAHINADLTSAILLVRAWSDAHRRACIVFPPFLHAPALEPRPNPNPRSALFSSKSAAAAAASTEPAATAKMSSATFVFSDASVKSLLSDAGDASPFDALAALFWTRIAAPELGAADLTLGIDMRKRMHAPLPYAFYGNAFHFYGVHGVDLGAGLSRVAADLRREGEGVREEDFWEAVEWLHERRPGRREAEPVFQVYGPELTCVEVDRDAFAYGTPFEDNDGSRPAHVTCRVDGVEGAGLVLVMPAAAEGAARQVVVTLPDEVVAKLCRDASIAKYEPTVLFAPAGVKKG